MEGGKKERADNCGGWQEETREDEESSSVGTERTDWNTTQG